MPDMKADGYKAKAQGLPAVPPSALHPAGGEPRDWVFTEALCAGGVQVRYVHTRHPSSPYGKPYSHFQNSSHYQIQSPSSAHHPRKMKCCLAHKWSIRLSILFSECEERTRERGKLVDQKHDKPLPSVHRLTEGKGTSRFWNGNPSAHLRRRGFPDKRPYHRTVTRNGCCRESLYLKKSLVDITHESLYLLCADKQTHGRERHSSLRCCMNAAPFKRQSLQLDVALPLIR
jgi:hypothetical protein